MSLTLTLKDNGGNEVSGTGSSITLQNTVVTDFTKFDLYGDTTQQTYSGKNLLNVAGAGDTSAWVKNNNGGFTFTKNSSSDCYSPTLDVSIPANTNVTISYDADPNSTAVTMFCQWFCSDNTNLWSPNIDRDNATGTVTTTFSKEIVGVRFYFQDAQANGIFMEVDNFQIELGSSKTSYEPYVGGTASPNPDYPQTVHTVSGEQTITISGGNSQSQSYTIDLTGKNLLGVGFESGNININTGQDQINTDAVRIAGYVSINPNTQYTISGAQKTRWGIYYTADKTFISSVQITSQATSGTITTPANARYFRYYLPATTSTDLQEQIEKGSTATAYVPYNHIELCKIGTYQDYIYKSGDDWYVHKEVKKLDMSTINAWASDTAGSFYRTGFSSAYGIAPGILYSNDFTYSDIAWSGAGKFGLPDSGNIWLMISDTTVSRNDLPTWLGNKGAIMYGVLATPTETKITDSTLIGQLEAVLGAGTYNGTTIITSAGEDLPVIMDVAAGSSINEKTYTEVELSDPLTITDVEGKSSITTLNGNVYVDYVYNKKEFTVSIFNLSASDYAEIRGFYDRQFTLHEFPTITIPELGISDMVVYFQIGDREINSQCIKTNKLTLKFRETAQQ